MSLTVSTTSLSAEEQEQLQQTIEMFEVIVQASPQDTQSLEILKDAYTRLGKPESLTVARRLADTYRELGQLSQALLEYENLLQRDSTNMEVIAAIGEVEEKLEKSGKKVGAAPTGPIKLDFGAVAGRPVTTIPGEPGTLITTNQTQRYEGPAGPGSSKKLDREGSLDESNEQLGKFLTQNRLVSEEVVVSALERISKKNKTRKQNQLAMSLIDEICRRGSIELDQLLCGILDRSKFAYIPLEYYDVDRADREDAPGEPHHRPADRPFRYHEPHGDDRDGQSLRRARQGSRAATPRLQHPMAPRLAGGHLQGARARPTASPEK